MKIAEAYAKNISNRESDDNESSFNDDIQNDNWQKENSAKIATILANYALTQEITDEERMFLANHSAEIIPNGTIKDVEIHTKATSTGLNKVYDIYIRSIAEYARSNGLEKLGDYSFNLYDVDFNKLQLSTDIIEMINSIRC